MDIENQYDFMGFRQGVWRKRSASGQMQFEENFVNNLRQGLWKAWDEYGNVILEINFVEEIQEGEVILYKY